MRDGIEALKNSGIAFINRAAEARPSGPVTVIVVGVPRSGTSMVAACLRELGVYLGDNLDKAVYEDMEIANALEGGNHKELSRLIAARNSSHELWGFKRPAVFNVIDRFVHLFRNPRFVITFRDPVAMAKRNEVSIQMEFLKALQLGGDSTNELIQFVSGIREPAMLVSYEKALLGPKSFTSALVSFCGISAPPDAIEKATATIENGPPLYLDASRFRFEGRLDRVTGGFAVGWARRIGQKQPQVVVILQNGREIGRGKASEYRPDLKESNREGGNCAFKIALSDASVDKHDVLAQIANSTYQLPK